jgi:sucrose-6-phosphate hydrolase SacC (GH32 family)
MGKISRRWFLRSAAAGTAIATLTADLLASEDVNATAGTGKDALARVREIAAVRYAPAGWYMKDHCLVCKDGRWHLFAPLGKIGTSWEDPGSEETAEHMVSTDLVHWQHLGTAVAASRRDGYFDKTMGGIAPHVIQHDGTYFMFYSGWTFPSKRPNFNNTGYRMSIGLATSRDLDYWEKPKEFAKDGLGVSGTDCCVVRDESKGRWLMYTWTGQTPVYQSRDLWHWSPAGTALTSVDMGGGIGESPFVMRHPQSQKWIIFFHHGYSVSDDPLKFPPVRQYPFKAGWHPIAGVKASGAWGDGTNGQADDDGAGFAHEVLEFSGQWYMTGVVGRDGQFKLKFTPIAWTADSLCLAK